MLDEPYRSGNKSQRVLQASIRQLQKLKEGKGFDQESKFLFENRTKTKKMPSQYQGFRDTKRPTATTEPEEATQDPSNYELSREPEELTENENRGVHGCG